MTHQPVGGTRCQWIEDFKRPCYGIAQGKLYCARHLEEYARLAHRERERLREARAWLARLRMEAPDVACEHCDGGPRHRFSCPNA